MIVLDCDAAIAIVRETQSGKALDSLILQDEMVVSPQVFIAEAAHVIKKYYSAGLVDQRLAHIHLDNAIDLVDEFVDMQENCIEAFDESIRHGHSTYDMFYLTLARRTGATLFTLDKRLVKLCEKLKIDCVHFVDVAE